MDDYESALNANHGRPDLIVSPKENGKFLTKKERNELQHDFNTELRGVHNSGKVLIASGQVNVEKMGYSPRDLQFQMGRPWSRDQIANAFGVPVSMLKSEGVPRANLESALYQYAKFTIQPRLTMYSQVINEVLIPMWDQEDGSVTISNRVFLAYENVVPEDKEQMLQQQTADLSGHVRTINEIRAERGLDPVTWGDEPYAGPGGGMGLPFRDHEPEQVKAANVALTPPWSEPAMIEYTDEAGVKHYATSSWEITEDAKGNATVIRCGGHSTKETDDIERTGGPNDDPLTRDEKEVEEVQREEYAAIQKDALAQLKAGKVAIAVNTTEIAKEFAPKAAIPIGRITFRSGNAALAAADLSVDLVPWIDNPSVVQAIEKQCFRFLKSAGDTVQDRFTAAMKEGLEAGENITELTTRLEDVFAGIDKQGNAEMIARTESARAQTQGSIDAMKEAGFSKQKWVAAGDACPFCLDMEQRFDTRSIGDPYMMEGQVQEVQFGTNEDGSPHMIKLAHNYGDVIGPPLHPNCRCVLTFEE